jgi:hypothetical protein
LDHAPGPGGTKNNPLWTTSAPNVFSRQGVGDLRGGKVWSKWAAPPANQRGIANSVGWRGAPRGWTTRAAREEHKTTHFGQPPRPTAPNVFSRQGVGDLRGGKVWSKCAAPPANQRGIVNSVGWCGAPRGWTTRPAWEEHRTTHFGQPPRPTCSADRVWETSAAARCGPNGRRPPPTNAE